jgi:hypothetical protein
VLTETIVLIDDKVVQLPNLMCKSTEQQGQHWFSSKMSLNHY